MKIKVFSSIFLLSTMMFAFQNCGDFSVQSFSSSHSSISGVPKSDQNLDKLYYRFEKTGNQSESYDVLFDLKAKKAELTLNIKEEAEKIKKSIDLSSADIDKIKNAVNNVSLDDLRHSDNSRQDIEEYIVSYLDDNSSFLAYLETAKNDLDAYKLGLGKENLTQILNEVVTSKLENSILSKIINLIENRDSLKSLANTILNHLKNIETSTDSTSSLSITINGKNWSWSDIKKYF